MRLYSTGVSLLGASFVSAQDYTHLNQFKSPLIEGCPMVHWRTGDHVDIYWQSITNVTQLLLEPADIVDLLGHDEEYRINITASYTGREGFYQVLNYTVPKVLEESGVQWQLSSEESWYLSSTTIVGDPPGSQKVVSTCTASDPTFPANFFATSTAPSWLDEGPSEGFSNTHQRLIIGCVAGVGFLFLALILGYCLLRRRRKGQLVQRTRPVVEEHHEEEHHEDDIELEPPPEYSEPPPAYVTGKATERALRSRTDRDGRVTFEETILQLEAESSQHPAAG